MTILAIDTSTEYLSLAVMEDGKITGRIHKKAAMRHSSMLVPTIDKILKKAKLRIKDVDVFAISIGPGSFTGLRIGAVTIKGLSYSLGKKIVAIPTLDIIARNAKKFRGMICPVLDARKGKVYACIYKSDGNRIKKISRYLLMPLEDLKKRLKTYDKICFLGDIIGSKSWHPRAEVAAELALTEIEKKNFVKPENLEPMYIYSRECDVKGI